MDKEQRDALEALAQEAHSEHWCLHPNGTSVWTGEEYQPDPNVGAPQYMVCKPVAPIDEIEVRRMEFIAGCNPATLLELLEFYGLSDTRIERGIEDNDEVCDVCGYATSEGHTHAECFKNGKSEGHIAENLECALKLCEALGVDYKGDFFGEALKHVDAANAELVLLREDAEILAELVDRHHLTDRQREARERIRRRP